MRGGSMDFDQSEKLTIVGVLPSLDASIKGRDMVNEGKATRTGASGELARGAWGG
jgi:hypothetical protein